MKLAGVEKRLGLLLSNVLGALPLALCKCQPGNYAVNAIVNEGLNRDLIEPLQPTGEGAAAPMLKPPA
jgi:hypothetical protein